MFITKPLTFKHYFCINIFTKVKQHMNVIADFVGFELISLLWKELSWVKISQCKVHLIT